MSTDATTLHPLAADYLKRLRSDARALPRGARRELVAEIEVHLAETTSPDMTDAAVLTVLDRLGDPEEIVAAERIEAVSPSRAPGVHEWAAIFLLLFGGFFFGIGWVAGLVLLWSSAAWTTRDKWLGTLILPGGLAGAFVIFAAGAVGSASICTHRVVAVQTVTVGSTPNGAAGTTPSGSGVVVPHVLHPFTHCTGGVSTPVEILIFVGFVILLVAPIAMAIYLARRAGAGSSSPAVPA